MVGHDLRNPLQVIVGTSYFLKKQLKNALIDRPDDLAEIEDIINTINDETDYMNKIVLDLHDYAKAYTLDVREHDIQSLIKGLVKSVKTDNVDISLDFEEIPLLEIDETAIRRVFQNILTNSVQAMPDGGKLTIRGVREKDNLHISFIDTGVGIPQENLEKLFIPLFTTKSKGTGFGLPVCKRFLENHGGQICVESEEGKGSTFTVILPYNNATSDLM